MILYTTHLQMVFSLSLRCPAGISNWNPLWRKLYISMVTAHCRSISPPTNSTGLVWGLGGSGTPTTQRGVLFAPKKCLGCAINIRNPSHAKICFIYIYCLGDLFFSPAGAPFLGLLVYNEAISDGEDTQIWWYTTHCMYSTQPGWSPREKTNMS